MLNFVANISCIRYFFRNNDSVHLSFFILKPLIFRSGIQKDPKIKDLNAKMMELTETILF